MRSIPKERQKRTWAASNGPVKEKEEKLFFSESRERTHDEMTRQENDTTTTD
jgi:hypothetical protein